MHPWRCLNVHPWSMGVEWYRIPRAKRIGESLDCVHLCVAAKFAAAFDCIGEILDCFDDQILGRQSWLCDVLVLEIDCVRDSFCSCGLDENEVAAVVIWGRR